MRLPRATANPTELGATALILADHVIASAVLFYGHVALGTLLGVGRDPVRSLRVIIVLLEPLLQPFALDRIVPKLATAKAE